MACSRCRADLALEEAEEQAEGRTFDSPLTWAEQAQFVLACRIEFEGAPGPAGPDQQIATADDGVSRRDVHLRAAGQPIACSLAAACAHALHQMMDNGCRPRMPQMQAPSYASRATRSHGAWLAEHPAQGCPSARFRPAEERDQLAEAMDVSLQEEQQRKQAQLPLHERPDREIWQVRAWASQQLVVGCALAGACGPGAASTPPHLQASSSLSCWS